jgi:6,7-dimethyl-8-ribityllumazine synthase
VTSEGSPVEELEGTRDAAGLRIAILVGRFNAEITERLLAGARSALVGHGAAESEIEVVRVPGAWELPQAAARAVDSGRFDALIALGCVIRGETPHFDYVCEHASLGLGEVSRQSEIPVVFGVLTTENEAQAMARAGEGPANKGHESALAALEMIAALRCLGAG